MRVNVRKYMAPLFDRWRHATVLGWRHRRGVEKLRIVSQERVCRAWFQKRQEEKRCVLGNILPDYFSTQRGKNLTLLGVVQVHLKMELLIVFKGFLRSAAQRPFERFQHRFHGL